VNCYIVLNLKHKAIASNLHTFTTQAIAPNQQQTAIALNLNHKAIASNIHNSTTQAIALNTTINIKTAIAPL